MLTLLDDQFNANGQMHEVDIPDIFDVLEGGEDESAVKFLLGFSADDDGLDGEQQFVVDSMPSQSLEIGSLQSTTVSGESNSSNDDSANSHDPPLTKEGKPRKRDPVDPSRCIYNCDNCDKAFTTKFNLKRHINLHCNKSKEAGVPIQGPPSASMPSRKARERREALAAAGLEFGTSNTTKKTHISSKTSKAKNLKRNTKNPVAQHVVHVTTTATTTKNNVTVVKPTASTTKANIALPSTITYQVAGRQQQTVSFQVNNNQQQQRPKQQHPTIVRISAPAQQQQHLKIMRPQQQPVLPMQPLPESTLQMIQIAQQPQQKQQFVQQRIVRVVQQNHQQQFQRQATIVGHIQGSNGTNIPILQQNGAQGVLQAIPISFLPAAAKAIVTR